MSQKQVLTVSGQYDQVRETCDFVCEGARAAGFDETAVFHIELACDEACTNIIEHAYGDEKTGLIHISYETEDEQFIITFHDNGRTFDPDTIPLPPTVQADAATDSTIRETLKAGGLGLHFMRQLMDSVTFQSDPQQGNTLIMVKKLPDHQP
jgi:anti-sigma regulatory factor (Ser/Thr protein kinase)